MRLTKTLALGALAACTVATAAVPAAAHPAPFTVTAGTAAAGTSVPVTLTSGTFTWKDTTTGVLVSCTSVVLRGSLVTGASGGRVGAIDAGRSSFVNCTGFSGLKFAITGSGTWTLDVTDSSAGTSSVTVSDVRAHLQTTAGPNCGFDLAAPTGSFASGSTATTEPGSLGTTYANGSQKLALPATNPGSLGLWNVRGGTSGALPYCVSPVVFKQGDRMTWSANWTLTADSAPNNPVAIT